MDCSKGPLRDRDGFASLVQELSKVFRPRGLLLSAAVSPSKAVIDRAYNVHKIAHDLDWISVMSYDYHGHWDKQTGHVAPMYQHPDDQYEQFNTVSRHHMSYKPCVRQSNISYVHRTSA